MWCCIRQISSKLLFVGVLVLLLFLGWGGFTAAPGLAEIRQAEEAPGQMLYQSRHSLPDRAGHSWQVVLFKRVKSGQVASVSLRLVGFPGIAEFVHPQPLEIKIGSEKTLTAEDMFAEESPAPNVGQYNIKGVLLQLPTNTRVLLSLPMTGDRSIDLPIPPSIVLEWQAIANR